MRAMKNDYQGNQSDEGLLPVIDKFEKAVADHLQKHPQALWFYLAFIVLLVLSPLAVCWWVEDDRAKDWSDVVKNVVESGAVLAGVFAIIKWVNERRDRATDVLLRLEGRFQLPTVNE